tara:strand:+ start:381 stop:551 length:171 start_codon:yes stop_codon:yes gene_type:complete
MDTFTIGELSIAIVSLLGALGLCLRGSKCTTIKAPCLTIHREIDTQKPEMDIEQQI